MFANISNFFTRNTNFLEENNYLKQPRQVLLIVLSSGY